MTGFTGSSTLLLKGMALSHRLLGYGSTDKPRAVELYIFKSMAANIVALLDHEGIDKFHSVRLGNWVG
jgi:pimeloyl-ACP methyl ester carboxylesterase